MSTEVNVNQDVSDAIAAAKKNDLVGLERWLKSGNNPNQYDAEGWTPLLWAASRGNTESVKLLLANRKMPADSSMGHRISKVLPIHMAGHSGSAAVAEVLLENNPEDLNAVWDLNGHTVLLQAVFYGHVELTKMLLSKGARTDITTARGLGPYLFFPVQHFQDSFPPGGIRYSFSYVSLSHPGEVFHIDPSAVRDKEAHLIQIPVHSIRRSHGCPENRIVHCGKAIYDGYLIDCVRELMSTDIIRGHLQYFQMIENRRAYDRLRAHGVYFVQCRVGTMFKKIFRERISDCSHAGIHRITIWAGRNCDQGRLTQWPAESIHIRFFRFDKVFYLFQCSVNSARIGKGISYPGLYRRYHFICKFLNFDLIIGNYRCNPFQERLVVVGLLLSRAVKWTDNIHDCLVLKLRGKIIGSQAASCGDIRPRPFR